MEWRVRRRSVVLLAILAASLGPACAAPGTDQAVIAYRCSNPPRQTEPADAPRSFEPVWRTYVDARAGFSLALPANWDGLALDTGHVEADLADIEKRSSQIADSVRKGVAASPASTAFFAVGAPNAAELWVTPVPRGKDPALCVMASLDWWQGWRLNSHYRLEGRLRVTQATFPAGDATVIRFFATRKDGSASTTNVELILRTADGPVDLLFSVDRRQAAGLEGLAWKIADSLRVGRAAEAAAGANPARSCLYAEVVPNLARASGSCPLPVGSALARFDCTGYDLQTPAAVLGSTYDIQRGTITGGAALDGPRSEGCPFDTPVGSGISLVLAGTMPADGVAVVDLRLTSTSRFAARLAMRQDPAGHISVTLGPDGGTEIAEYWPAETVRRMGLGGFARGGSMHRLVLAVSGSAATGWVDGQPLAGTPRAPAHPGNVQAFIGDMDASSALSFEVLRFFVYRPAPGG